MLKTKISSKGQVVIPKEIRSALRWQPGAELAVEPKGDAVVLRLAEKPWRLPTQEEIDRVTGILNYKGPLVSIEEMDLAVDRMLWKKWKK